MKRVTLLVAAVGVAMLLASGVALAATFDGTPGPDTFVGTDRPDDIRGRGGDDTLSGAGAIDRLRGLACLGRVRYLISADKDEIAADAMHGCGGRPAE